MLKTDHLLISCEHGGNRIPARYRRLFEGGEAALSTHRGYDLGALELAKYVARAFRVSLRASTVSRLLVELNRSAGHPKLFSEFTRPLSPIEKERILDRYYHPYRDGAEVHIENAARTGGRVIHVSVHTFTPALNGEVRRADIGLLYDPARSAEAAFCRGWQRIMRRENPRLSVRRNYPYLGKSDGLTTHLRKRFPMNCYWGVELEVNNKHTREGSPCRKEIRSVIVDSLKEALDSLTT